MGHFAGSYPYAEYYEFNVKRQDLISRIEILKNDYPAYILITSKENGEFGEYEDTYSDNFYHTYFYFKDEDLTLHCFININGSEYPTLIGFSGISKGVNFASWKDINTDQLSRRENKEIKKKFEPEILDRLGIKWKHDRWYN